MTARVNRQYEALALAAAGYSTSTVPEQRRTKKLKNLSRAVTIRYLFRKETRSGTA